MNKAPDYERIAHVLQRQNQAVPEDKQLPQTDEDAWIEYYLELADRALSTERPFLVGRRQHKKSDGRRR